MSTEYDPSPDAEPATPREQESTTDGQTQNGGR